MNSLVKERRIVLVTGGSGFIGRHALPLLHAHFDEVHATYCSADPPRICNQTRWHQTDLLHPASAASLIAAVRPTHLLHLAWCTEHGQFWNDLTNPRWLEASVGLARAFAEFGGRRIVTAGTCAEYDWSHGHCDETTTPCAPATLYGACKRALALAVESIAGLSAAHARLFHTFGPHEDSRRLVPAVIRSLLRHETARCSHGTQIRSYLYVKDAAAALVQLLLSDVRGPINVASGAPIAVRKLVSQIAEQMGQPTAVEFGAISSRTSEPQQLTADVSRLRDEVHFAPTYALETAIEETIAAHSPASTQSVVPMHHRPAVTCRLCQAEGAVPFLRRTGVPVHQNLVLRDRAGARAILRGTLDMHVCRNCGFVFNAAFDPALLSYGEQYDNTQTCSPAFNDYVNELARRLLVDRGVRGKTIVEIGCGKGQFLRKLVEDAAAGNRGIGFDPAYVGPTEDLQGRLRFVRQFYDRTTAVPCDAVVCRHVIEHVPDPGFLIDTAFQALSNRQSESTTACFETPCVRWIIENGVVWDFFYEHCSLFTADSLRFAFERHGFTNIAARHIFGGQYLWLEADRTRHAASLDRNHCQPGDAGELVRRAMEYGAHECRQIDRWKQSIHQLAGRGVVAIWGAGAKGATFVNLVDPDGAAIECVVDLNPAKQGAFLVGTGTPIVAPNAESLRRVSAIAVLNPNYVQEIRRQVEQLGLSARVIDFSSETENRSLLAA